MFPFMRFLLYSVRTGQVPVTEKPDLDHGVQEGLPAGAGSALVPFRLGLLEGVVDGDRERLGVLLGEAAHRRRHSAEKKSLCFFLVLMPVRSGNQFLGLGDGERGEEVGKD